MSEKTPIEALAYNIGMELEASGAKILNLHKLSNEYIIYIVKHQGQEMLITISSVRTIEVKPVLSKEKMRELGFNVN